MVKNLVKKCDVVVKKQNFICGEWYSQLPDSNITIMYQIYSPNQTIEHYVLHDCS